MRRYFRKYMICLALTAVVGGIGAICANAADIHINTLDDVKQLVLVATPDSTSSYATVTAYQQNNNGAWDAVNTVDGRVGKNGIVPIAQRKQGTSTTPQGILKIINAMGRNDDPGSIFSYTKITNNMYWNLNSGSATYNQLVYSNPSGDYEHLINYDPAYNYLFTTDYNIEQIQGKGGAIFFHCNGSGATGGCISVPENTMKWYMTWLNPAANPAIVVTTADSVQDYLVSLNIEASNSGTVSGAGLYTVGSTAQVQADRNLTGWYDANGTLLSSDAAYSLSVNDAQTIYAMFEGDSFYDVHSSDWYMDYANQAKELGLLNGTAPFRFDGAVSMNRAMALQILYNMEGKPQTNTAQTFDDVDTASWYYDAVQWGASEGITNGMGNNQFEPNSLITREQLVSFLYRYSGSPACEQSETTSFADGETVSAWAQDAFSWAIQQKIINGVSQDGAQYLLPKNTATRAEAATIFVRSHG